MTLRLEMLNRALLRIGANPLASEMVAAAPQHLAVYDSVAEDFAAKPFKVFKAYQQLVRVASAAGPYTYAYQLPPERCGPPRAVYMDETRLHPIQDYDIIGDLVMCNHEQVWCAFGILRGPERWTGDLREAFTTTLMAELALSVREDRPLHDRLWQKARGSPAQNGIGGLMGAALEQDAQAVPSPQIAGGINPLVDCR